MERNLREYRRSDWNGCMQVCDGTTEAVCGSVPIHFGAAEVSRILKRLDTSNKDVFLEKRQQPNLKKKPEQTEERKPESRLMAIAMKRRARRKKIQKFVVILLVATAFFTGFFGRTLFDAYAKENRTDSLNRYYTSIRLKPGDNLWNIASRYAEGSEYTVAEYVQELKRMNNLRDEQVHSGEYLTIVYFSE
ncbi:MAG: LysM peptidoglycan-binding domain-containing protein [Lachnospiraceae bacterium]|jgi:hypothetical protein|nr:LysM peptidoglycan-binding domain-containing protein [Lachnospiraceae bacterium]